MCAAELRVALAEPEAQALRVYRCQPVIIVRAPAVVRVHGVSHRPEELSARVLGTLKDAAEDAYA